MFECKRKSLKFNAFLCSTQTEVFGSSIFDRLNVLWAALLTLNSPTLTLTFPLLFDGYELDLIDSLQYFIIPMIAQDA